MKKYIFILMLSSFYIKTTNFNPGKDLHPTFKNLVEHRIEEKIEKTKKSAAKKLLK